MVDGETPYVDVARTALDKLIDEGAMLVQGLQDLDHKPKLTGSAFIREAAKIAGVSVHKTAAIDRRIARVQRRIAKAHGGDATRALVRTLARKFRGDNFPIPNPDAIRMVRLFGWDEAPAEITALGLTPSDIQLVAAAEAVRRWPEAFGRVTDWEHRTANVAHIRERLGPLYSEMRSAWHTSDILFDLDITQNERDRGLVRLHFRRAPGVFLVADDWPEAVVRHVATHEISKPDDRRKPKASKKASRPRPRLREPECATA